MLKKYKNYIKKKQNLKIKKFMAILKDKKKFEK